MGKKSRGGGDGRVPEAGKLLGRWWNRPGIRPAELRADLHEAEVRAALAAGACRDHGGVPVGCVVCPRTAIDPLRAFLIKRVGSSLRFKGIDALPRRNLSADNGAIEGSDEGDGAAAPQHSEEAAIHMPPEAAGVLEEQDSDEEIATFLASIDATYYPGIRPMDNIWTAATPVPDPDPDPDPDADMGEQQPQQVPAQFTFAEIFAGIGGFRLGLEPLGGRCVLAAEIDGGAVETYTANFKGLGGRGRGVLAAGAAAAGAAAAGAATAGAAAATAAAAAASPAAAATAEADEQIVGDICEYGAEQLPAFDVLTAGFPCQPFSLRGQERGLACEKGQLFRELVRLLRAKLPKAFLFEVGDRPESPPLPPPAACSKRPKAFLFETETETETERPRDREGFFYERDPDQPPARPAPSITR